MLHVNRNKIDISKYPDGTFKISVFPTFVNDSGKYEILWLYEHGEEMALYFLVNHIRNFCDNDIELCIPYLPYARMDRVKERHEVFTLKHFADFINSLNFSTVWVRDVHSPVALSLIKNIKEEKGFLGHVRSLVNSLFVNEDNFGIYYPDKGAKDRYEDCFPRLSKHILYGEKIRDWKTGNIVGLEVIGEIEKGQPILIIDDICSYGTTFLKSAEKLKELGAGNIYLYCTHIENSILEGKLINSGLLKKIYTTNSIFTEKHRLIEVLDVIDINVEINETSTKGQYTGLVTKYFKEKVREGDVLVSGGYTFVVKFGITSDGHQAFYAHEINDVHGTIRQDLPFWLNERKTEIIGNIHHNPKLLEKGVI